MLELTDEALDSVIARLRERGIAIFPLGIDIAREREALRAALEPLRQEWLEEARDYAVDEARDAADYAYRHASD